jgi:hypothetical protein
MSYSVGNYYSFSELSSDEKCTICLQSLGIQNCIGKLECGHNFCFYCIFNWSKSSSTCCTCRHPIQQIFKIQRMDLSKAIEFQKQKILEKLNKPVLRHTEFNTIIPIPKSFSLLLTLSSKTTSTKTTESDDSLACISYKYKNDVGILTKICYVKRQVQRISTEGDDVYAAQIFLQDQDDFYNGLEESEERQNLQIQDREELQETEIQQQETEEIQDIEQNKDKEENEVCKLCFKKGLLLICDGCNSLQHLECVSPRLMCIPEGLWLCTVCEEEKNNLNFKEKSTFIQHKQTKQTTQIASLLEQKEENESKETKESTLLSRDSNENDFDNDKESHLQNQKKKRKSFTNLTRELKRKKLRGYQDDGFVVPCDDDFC